jgi:hypothetical protein
MHNPNSEMSDELIALRRKMLFESFEESLEDSEAILRIVNAGDPYRVTPLLMSGLILPKVLAKLTAKDALKLASRMVFHGYIDPIYDCFKNKWTTEQLISLESTISKFYRINQDSVCFGAKLKSEIDRRESVGKIGQRAFSKDNTFMSGVYPLSSESKLSPPQISSSSSEEPNLSMFSPRESVGKIGQRVFSNDNTFMRGVHPLSSESKLSPSQISDSSSEQPIQCQCNPSPGI